MCYDHSDDNDDLNTDDNTTLVTASAALRAAATLIEERGFHKRMSGLGKGGEYSAMAALRQAALSDPHESLFSSGFASEWNRIDRWFVNSKGDSMMGWASRPAASRIRVVQALRKAAAELV